MKVYVQTDIEGCAGFCFFENRGNPSVENVQHRHRMVRLLTNEVNAAVLGAFDANASEVVVNDSHGSGYNILFEELDPRCRIIHGRNCSGPHWLPLLDDSCDALVLIGMHAMGGTENAIVPHSKWEINDGELYLSEASMAAALAGDFAVPTVFVSGDDKVTAEVSRKIPSIYSLAVKEALGAYQAVSMIPAAACRGIRNGVREALQSKDAVPPFKVDGPLKLQLLDSEGHIPPLEPLRSDAVEADTLNEAFMTYLRTLPWNNFDTTLPDGFQFPAG